MQNSKETPSWDDLRVALAVARAGGLAGAARALGVEHSTVYRRVNELEERLGARLFERDRRGYRATLAGEALIESAVAMEAEATRALRRLAGEDLRPEGPVRLATSELLAYHVLPRLMAGLIAALPGISLEVQVSNTLVDLDRREADLALRVQTTPPEHLLGRRVAMVGYAVFGAPSLLGEGPVDPNTLPWIGFDSSSAHCSSARWLQSRWPDARFVTRCDSALTIHQLSAQGIGLSVLPTLAGASDPRLRRLDVPSSPPEMPIWLLRHADVAQNVRVRALAAWLGDHLQETLTAMAAEGDDRVISVVPAQAPGHEGVEQRAVRGDA